MHTGAGPLDVPTIRTREEAEAALAVVAALTVQFNAAVTEQNSKLLAVRVHDAEILRLRNERARHEASLEDWARSNRDQMGDKKSLEMRYGRIAFKNSPPRVRLLDGWTDERVLAKLRKLPKIFRRFIRIKPELDRQKILSEARNAQAAPLSAKELERFGVSIERKENFSIEPKLEQLS